MAQKTIIVTGASRGVGRALTALCLERGHRVMAVARNTEELDRMAAVNSSLTCLSADLSNPGEVLRAGRQIADAVERGSVLVNNAAIQDDWRFFDDRNTGEALHREITLNLTAPILLSRMLCDAGLVQTVVNIQSLLALKPKTTAAIYSATKAGLRLFAEALRLQKTAEGPLVLEVYLPLVDTDMTTGRGRGKISPETAAGQICQAMMSRRARTFVGKARLMAIIHGISPGLAGMILSRM